MLDRSPSDRQRDQGPGHITRRTALPGRLAGLSPLNFAVLVGFAAFVIVSAGDVAPSLDRLADGVPRMANLLGRMLPPNTEIEFLTRIFWRIVETFQIALVGTVIGVLISFPVAWLSARGVSPLGIFGYAFKMLVSLFRTIPDLVWALVFVSAVGLGAVAGTMTIIVDTIGFCGRFFAEAMEDSDQKPRDSLSAIGAGSFSVLCAAIIPDAMPSFINTALFALEKALRSSVVLGLVGAGGIGQELKVAFDLFQYRNASAIILVIFAIVLAMEYVTDRLRSRIQ